MLITVGYLKYQTKLQIICDLSFLEYQGEVDLYIDWRQIHPSDVEEIPHNMTIRKGNPARIIKFVVAYNANDLETRLYFTGVLMFFNKTQIQWHIRRQEDQSCWKR